MFRLLSVGGVSGVKILVPDTRDEQPDGVFPKWFVSGPVLVIRGELQRVEIMRENRHPIKERNEKKKKKKSIRLDTRVHKSHRLVM